MHSLNAFEFFPIPPFHQKGQISLLHCSLHVKSRTCSIMSVTIQAVTKSPIQVPIPAAFMKVLFSMPRKCVTLYASSSSPPRLRKALNIREKMKRLMSAVRNITIHEPLSSWNMESFIHLFRTSLWTKSFPTNMPVMMPRSHRNTFSTAQPPEGYLQRPNKLGNYFLVLNSGQ